MDSTVSTTTTTTTTAFDSGFDSCTTSGNVTNQENIVSSSTNIIENVTSNHHQNEEETESPTSTTTDDGNDDNKNHTNSSPDSGSTFEIIDNSPPSPTSYQLVEDSPEGNNPSENRNFLKLDLNRPRISEIPGLQEVDNRFCNNIQQQQSNIIKTREIDHDEERDTFSPIATTNGYPSFPSPSTSSSNSSGSRSNNLIPSTSGRLNKDIKHSVSSSSDIHHNLSLPIASPLNLSISNTSGSSSSVNNITASISTITSSNITGGSSNNNSTGSSNNSDLDNKIIEKNKKIRSSSTKEEKQRQNEEIAIMETSSVSSETGSWESVFPHHNTQTTNIIATGNNFIEIKDISSEKYNKFERKESSDEVSQNTPITSCGQSHNVTASCPVSACFIDAASLLDESEVSNVVYPPVLPEGCFAPKPGTTEDNILIEPSSSNSNNQPAINLTSQEKSNQLNNTKDLKHSPEEFSQKSESSQSSSENWKKKLNLDKLETFHKSFELCKTKQDQMPLQHSTEQNYEDESNVSSSSSDSSRPLEDNPTTALQQIEENLNNLSDEEKLWKRENSKKGRPNRIEVKDQFNKESPSDQQVAGKFFSNVQDVSSDQNEGVYEFNEQEINKIRKEQERKQGNLVFQNNIQQFSGHVINPKIPFITDTGPIVNYSSVLTNTVSETNKFGSECTASSAPSLAWSDIDANIGRHTSNYDSSSAYGGDTSDFGDSTSNQFNNSKIPQNSGAPSVSNCILPDTPHNSIVQIGHNTKVIKDSASAYSEEPKAIKIPKTRCDDAAPILSGGSSIKDFTPKQCESPPVRRKTETCPIISGGFISLDLQRNDEDSDSNSKPLIEKSKSKQQTWVVDMSDCLSNGKRRRSTSSSSSAENTARSINSIERNNSVNSQKNGLGFYVSLNDMEAPKSIDSDYSSGTTGGGTSENISRKLSRSLHESVKKATGFYVDLSESENSRNATPPPSQVDTNNSTPRSSTSDADKKNIFSMFIDLGEKKILSKKGPFSLASRLSSSILQKKYEEKPKSGDSSLSNSLGKNHYQNENLDSAGETSAFASSDESHKPSLLMNTDCNEEDPPDSLNIIPSNQVFRRVPLSLTKEEFKRHSWNNPEASSISINRSRSEHKRSSSLSASDSNDKNIMNILDKIPLISKTSSMSIDSSLSPFDDITYSKTDLSTYSNNSAATNSIGDVAENVKEVKQIPKKYRRDAKLNETFDKSSQGSITDGILSKDLSPSSNTTDTDDLTFQQDDNGVLINETSFNSGQFPIINNVVLKDIGRPMIMETIIEAKETSSPKKSVNTTNNESSSKQSATHTMETLHATIEKQKMLLETVNENSENCENAFVRLSDLDKPIPPMKFELHSPEAIMSKSVGNQRNINRLFQETSRNRPHSWAMTRSTGNSIVNITNSVENLRSLSRLFPHLSKEFSNSLPNNVYSEKIIVQNQSTSLMYQQRSPSEIDFINSADISTADSSLASSFSRSALDESSISCRQPRRLGEDLLKMFLQEIGTDVIVEVNGRRIKAHKCILRSRCQYFAAMLAGGWVQSAGNVISLQGYSYSAVHFALCHIYSGASHPPDGISLMELAALADLLGLEGLKEVTAHALKSNYCHNFHKPCSGCIDGILQVLPVALNHALDDLYRKCLKWTCRHYLKVWPTRSFAQLPSEIFNRCRQQLTAHLTSETVLQSILDCDQLIAQIAHFRWAVIVENLLRDILDAAYAYISDHFSSLIASDSFLSLGNDKSSDITKLENLLLRTASSLSPDQACRSYQRVTRLNSVLAAKVIKMPAPMADNKNASGNVPSHDYGNLIIMSTTEDEMEWNEEFIRLVSAILSAVEQCLTRQCSRAMRVTSWQRMDLELRKKIQKLACLTEPLDIRRSGGFTNTSNKQSYTKQVTYSSGSRNQDLYQVKLAIQAHSKRALEQDKQLYRATAHTQTNTQDRNTQTNEKGIQAASDRHSTGKNTKISVRTSTQTNPVQSNPKIKTQEKSTSLSKGHRRTLSEDSSVSAASTTQQVILRNHDNSTKSHSSSRPVSLTTTRPSSIPTTRPTSFNNKDIRPRYLEPRKSRGDTIKSSGNSNTLQIKNKHISSSDSSRNSSPATSKKLLQNAAARKIGGVKSINMSLDSLASPSKRSNQLKSNVENEISIDSLAESMRSSIITEKTISHESLRSGGVVVSGGAVINNNKNRQISRSNPGINKVHLLNTNNITKKPLNSIQTSKLARTKSGTSTTSTTGSQNTSGLSPSSITNKSSRLSSVSSTGFSPRDAFKNRSISVPASNSSIKKSFLSAKSREILARRAANLEKAAKLQQEQSDGSTTDNNKIETKSISTIIVTTTTTTTKSHPINKSNSSSAIPTRLKAISNLTSQSIGSKKKSPTSNNKHQFGVNRDGISTSSSSSGINIGKNYKLNLLNNKNSHRIENNRNSFGKIDHDKMKKNYYDSEKYGKEQKVEIIVDNQKNKYDDARYESKLERSSTFCKESSDLPVSDLEIIE